MVAVRDLQCGQDVGNMAEMGRFAEEFPVYGVSYQTGGKIWHRVSSEPEEIFQFLSECRAENIFPTFVKHWVNRILVPAGEKESYLFDTKIQFAQTLKKTFTPDFFQTLEYFSRLPSTNGAQKLLSGMKEDLTGCFDRELLNQFKDLVLFAHDSKRLTDETFYDYVAWLEWMYRQMEDDPVIKKDIKRTFCGFAYLDNQKKIHYIANAKPEVVYFKYIDFLLKGHLLTPIWSKDYWFQHIPDSSSIRKEFMKELSYRYTDEYYKILNAIISSPCAIEGEEMKQWMVNLKEKELVEQMEMVTYYKNKWHVL